MAISSASNLFPSGSVPIQPTADLSPRSHGKSRAVLSPLPKVQSSLGAMPTHVHKASAGQRRGRLAKMCFGVLAVGASIAAVAMVGMVFIPAPPPRVEKVASRSEPKSAGTIVLRSGSSGCQERSFDNQTGQISDQSSPCRSDVVLDARGMPVPAGTIHTLNSISKSFK